MSKYMVKFVMFYEVEVEAEDIDEAQALALECSPSDFHDLMIVDTEEVEE